jgi:hypothetical protein
VLSVPVRVEPEGGECSLGRVSEAFRRVERKVGLGIRCLFDCAIALVARVRSPASAVSSSLSVCQLSTRRRGDGDDVAEPPFAGRRRRGVDLVGEPVLLITMTAVLLQTALYEL